MQNIKGAWVYAVVGGHVIIVLLLLRFSPLKGQKAVWDKVMATKAVQLRLGRWRPIVHLPRADDVKLLVCCLAWPPSCFVSDATDKNGAPAGTNSHLWVLARCCRTLGSSTVQLIMQ